MSRSSELDTMIKTYILSTTCNDWHSDTPLLTNQEKIDFIQGCFVSEFQWYIDRVGRRPALKVYLMGLPSCLDLEFYNFEILKLAVIWGVLPEKYKDKAADKFLQSYWSMMANKLDQLFRGHRIPEDVQITPAVYRETLDLELLK